MEENVRSSSLFLCFITYIVFLNYCLSKLEVFLFPHFIALFAPLNLVSLSFHLFVFRLSAYIYIADLWTDVLVSIDFLDCDFNLAGSVF